MYLLIPRQVYLVDYGLAYRFSPEGVPKEYKEDPKRCHDGTIEFTSIDAHHGVCVYFLSFIKTDRFICILASPQGDWLLGNQLVCSVVSFLKVMLFYPLHSSLQKR